VLILAAVATAAGIVAGWHEQYFQPQDIPVVLPFYLGFYAVFFALPFVMPVSVAPGWKTKIAPWLASALAGPLFFYVLYKAFVALAGKTFIGVLPVAMAMLSVLALANVRQRFALTATDDPALARQRLRNLALFGAVALGFISVAIPLQLDKQWITIGWAIEAAAVWWLYGRVPHIGLKYFGMTLFLAVGVRLLLNDEVLRYHERGLPILNWILYTYGIAAVCCFVGSHILGRYETGRLTPTEQQFLSGGKVTFAGLSGLLGLLLVFALINLEIADYYSTGRYVELLWQRRYDRDLTVSVAWGIYALTLLIIGVWRKTRALRYVSLAFMILTIGKVFLYDLASLRGLHRVLSFLGLAFALMLVSLLYQRFVFRKEKTE
jgi:uncharacterized membrane protein